MHRIVLTFRIIFQKTKNIYMSVHLVEIKKIDFCFLHTEGSRLPLVSIIFVQGAVEDIGGQLWRLVPL
jgi:hypothetical protein